jgi:hypothetical protein
VIGVVVLEIEQVGRRRMKSGEMGINNNDDTTISRSIIIREL